MSEAVTAAPVKRLVTGIPGLDTLSRGGIPEGRTLLVGGAAGTGKTTLAVQFLVRGIEAAGEPCILVTCEDPADYIRTNAMSYGWDLAALEAAGQLLIIDLSGDSEWESTIVDQSYDLSPVIAAVEQGVRRLDCRRVAIDGLESLLSDFGSSHRIRRELRRVIRRVGGSGVTAIVTVEQTEPDRHSGRFGVEEFVADGVLVLRNRLVTEHRHRTAEILKLRGVAHIAGEFPFILDTEEGFQLLPLMTERLSHEATDRRISTGDATLDRICDGGVLADSSILISGPTGTGKTLLSCTFADEGARQGERVIYFTFEESEQQTVRNAMGWGFDFAQHLRNQQLRIVSDLPEGVGLAERLNLMLKAVDEFGPQRVVLDSLSALARLEDARAFRLFMISLTTALKGRGLPIYLTAIPGSTSGTRSAANNPVSTLTDMIVQLRYVETAGMIRRSLAVVKMRSSAHENRIFEFTISNRGIEIGEPFQDAQESSLQSHRSDPIADLYRPGDEFEL